MYYQVGDRKWMCCVLSSLIVFGFLTLTGCEDSEVDEKKPEEPAEKVDEKEAEKAAEKVEKVDDWQYKKSASEESAPAGSPKGTRPSNKAVLSGSSTSSGVTGTGSASKAVGGAPAQRKPAKNESLGFAVGGAKDVNNMRDNIENGFLPLPTDITCEGLFYDYYFDTGQKEQAKHLFEPSYSMALSPDPISRETERYLTVGLNSNLTEKTFERKDLDLTVVVDVSGSMSSSFNKYYYDGGVKQELSKEERQQNKMKVAREALKALLSHLRPDDRLAIVAFSNQAMLAKPLRKVEATEMDAIRDHISELRADGSTKMSAGMQMATDLYEEMEKPDPQKRERRIIFLTDAMPNLGRTSKSGLGGMFKANAKKDIYTTFVGIGVDFNSQLVETINKARGANHYTVHSPEQFKNRMDRDFELMVTPLVFNLELKLDADGYEIEKVYGSPEADEATGELMKVKTLFPSRTEEGKTKGGVVLLKLRRTDANNDRLTLKASYENRAGEAKTVTKDVIFPSQKEQFYANTGIRKAILLSRYAEMLRNWTTDQRKALKEDDPVRPVITPKTGIVPCPPERPRRLGQWERKSVSLQVSDTYRKFFKGFLRYMRSEMDALGDENLEQEVKILEKLANTQGKEQ